MNYKDWYPNATFTRLENGQEADVGHVFVDRLKDAVEWILKNPEGRGTK